MNKNIIYLICVFIFSFPLFGQSGYTIAVLPFSGDAVDESDGEKYARIFEISFANLNYTPITRASDNAIKKELDYQRTGATRDAKEFGTILGADYVVAGNIDSLRNRYIVTVQVIHVETGGVYKGNYRELDSLYDLNARLASDMAVEINEKLRKSPSQRKMREEEAAAKGVESSLNKERTATALKWTGVGLMAAGAIVTTVGIVGLVHWNMASTDINTQREYYMFKNPNVSPEFMPNSSYYNHYTRKEMFNAWQKEGFGFKPNDLFGITELGSGIMIGAGVAGIITGAVLFGVFNYRLSHNYYIYDFRISPTIFDKFGNFDPGAELAFGIKL